MTRDKKIHTMVTTALLVAVGIAIPMFFPKIVIPPASFTLASHVPVFIAMFISPYVAIAVALGTTAGFFFSTPLIVALRAFSHIIWVVIGSFMLKRSPELLQSPKKAALFGVFMALIHAAGEVAVTTWFYFGGMAAENFYQNGFVFSVLVMVGLGTVVHSMVDFGISVLVWKGISKHVPIPVSVRV